MSYMQIEVYIRLLAVVSYAILSGLYPDRDYLWTVGISYNHYDTRFHGNGQDGQWIHLNQLEM